MRPDTLDFLLRLRRDPARGARAKDAGAGLRGGLDLGVPVLPRRVVTTGPDGRSRLTGIGRERLVVLSLRGPGIEWRERDVYVMTRPAKPFHLPLNRRAPEL